MFHGLSRVETPSAAVRHDPTAISILRLPAVKARVSLSRSCIYDKLDPKSRRHDATFPKPVKLGRRAVGWVESEIQQWIEQRILASRTT